MQEAQMQSLEWIILNEYDLGRGGNAKTKTILWQASMYVSCKAVASCE